MTNFNVIVCSFGQHNLLCDLKCYHPRRYRYERTRCVAISTNTARGAMDVYEIFLSGWFDLRLWTRPGLIRIDFREIDYGECRSGAVKLGK
jgi:hypothetical protein